MPKGINVDTHVGSASQDPNNPRELAALDAEQTYGIGPNAGTVIAEIRKFVEAAAGTYTASVDLPAGAYLLDIRLWSAALWNAVTSASLIVGDVADPDGFWTAVDLKATDLLALEELSFSQPGTSEAGAYINSPIEERQQAFLATAVHRITGVVTTVGAGTTGITYMLVLYVAPTVVEATYAA